MPIDLWPPFRVIRSHLEPHPAPEAEGAGALPADAAPAPAAGAADLQLPLAELARRRQAVAERAFGTRWEPGRLLSVLHEGRLLGVLLDCPLEGGQWQGWMAASEADWASAFDVLLEPGDEPFEPLFGLVQAWNAVTLAPAPQWLARVQGEVSATRLAAIRAVHDESSRGAPPAIAPEPGRIALRTVAEAFTVLSGTPLGEDDPRTAYQDLYREAAARLSAASRQVARPASPPAALAQPARPGDARPPAAGGRSDHSPWARARRWFAADAWVRPAFALLALVVVVQNTGLMNLGGGSAEPTESEVRFRDVVTEPAGPSADLAVMWKPGVTMDDSARLLRSLDAEVVAGPDVRGAWFLRVPDLSQSSTALSASPLVQSVGPP